MTVERIATLDNIRIIIWENITFKWNEIKLFTFSILMSSIAMFLHKV